MNKKFLFSIVAVLVLTLIPASIALADPIVPLQSSIPLNNATANSSDCGLSSDMTCWHFVISPNNNHSYFVSLHLVFEDGSTMDVPPDSTIVPNGFQGDNVYVSTMGHDPLSLVAGQSTAVIVWDGKAAEPTKFQLSDICVGVPEAGSTLLLLGMALVPIVLSRRR